MPGKALKGETRESQIMTVFVNEYKLGRRYELTAVEVARFLMLEPSHHVRKLLASCVAKGQLEMRAESDTRCDNLPQTMGRKYWYKLSDRCISEIEDAARDIPVKISGVIAGQLRMF
jgi:hypothetical protein